MTAPPTVDAAAVAAENARGGSRHELALDQLLSALAARGIDADGVLEEIRRFTAAAPSWALGAGGTRFGRFAGAGEPRTLEEKIDDVAALNSLTGANRSISIHVPWDDPRDPAAALAHARARGIGFDAINSNTFQDNPSTTAAGAVSFKFGSFCHTDAGVRRAAVEHHRRVIELGERLGARALSVWLADGTSYPGQGSFRDQFERVAQCLHEVHAELPADWRLLIEHKPFEPAFYSTVNNDWGTSLLLAQASGERAACLVDLGHHLPHTNIEQIVSRLHMVGRLGGFHFNDSRYGDDDLTVGAVRPYQLFLVMLELLDAGRGTMPDIGYMIDASHNLKDPLEDLIQSTDALQHALALALCVDREELHGAQLRNDPAWAAEVLHAAYRTDVRPLVAEARARNGAALDPLATFRALGYREATIAARGRGGSATGL